ncbi:hypothetical protein HYH03_012983 [Edaphochlamys debaryana]|uniref:Uncharacterized protein n=1 Tax=Edaphochlamys debaryana TaxID=47281 RepID=A0A835XQN4_9CHLO|nr:hypothetical protein HYH03_012983 [Edaphochlamys debaryana]|eukprot:KAG2488478.1 hypothetical protein HYH03_012983 [Edaphochlamys debaryana]
MDADEVDGGKWDSWNRVLASLAGQLSGRNDDVLARLYELAVELRDKLRYSQGRLRAVKQELAVTAAAARSERHDAVQRLRELETEVARLAGAVHAQGSTLAARETVATAQAAENEQLRRHVAALESQIRRMEEDRNVLAHERNSAMVNLDKMSQLLNDSEDRVVTVQKDHGGLLSELVQTKGRLADLSALETLYGAARDELQRLDKENLELKDMVARGSTTLGRSRILDALGIPDSTDVFVSTRGGRGRRSGAGAGGATRSRSAPRTRSGRSPGGGTVGRGSFVPDMVPMLTADGYRNSTAVQPYRGGTAGRTGTPGRGRGGASVLEDAVSELAFLGPPSSAYPPDPENYVFYRVGGGYSPRLDPLQPTIPQPRASGWVPKDVVRLVQAFRHSYGLPLEWRFWEPLVLMIDEVYRSRADGSLAAMRTAQRDKLQTVKRQLRSALGYPTALANGKVAYLQRQLASARKMMAAGDRKGDMAFKQMAVKDYHLGAQLDRAVEENFALRRSLEELEDLYTSAAVEGGAAGGQGAYYTSSAGAAARSSPQQGHSGGGASGTSGYSRRSDLPYAAAGVPYSAGGGAPSPRGLTPYGSGLAAMGRSPTPAVSGGGAGLVSANPYGAVQYAPSYEIPSAPPPTSYGGGPTPPPTSYGGAYTSAGGGNVYSGGGGGEQGNPFSGGGASPPPTPGAGPTLHLS